MRIVIVVRRRSVKKRGSVEEEERGYDWALPRASCKQLFICQKSRPGGMGANKQRIEKLVARNSCVFQWRAFYGLYHVMLPDSQFPPPFSYSSRPCSNLTLPHRGLSSFVLICRPDDIYKEESGRHKKQMRGVRGVIIRIKVCKAPAHQFRPKPLFAALQPIKRRLVEIIPDSRQNISTVFFQFVQF